MAEKQSGPGNPSSPTIPAADLVAAEKAGIQREVGKLIDADGADAWSNMAGLCRPFALKLRQALVPASPALSIVEVHKDIMTHYHLRTPSGIIVDSTWLQWLEKTEDLSGLPRVFIGTREEFIAFVTPYSHLLPRVGVREKGWPRKMTPQEFVDELYGVGAQAHKAHDATAELLREHAEEDERRLLREKKKL